MDTVRRPAVGLCRIVVAMVRREVVTGREVDTVLHQVEVVMFHEAVQEGEVVQDNSWALLEAVTEVRA